MDIITRKPVRRPRVPRAECTCLVCGKVFLHYPKQAYKYCSRTCWYSRQLKSSEERFWSKVDKNGPITEHCPELGPCWLWTGAIYTHGYGVFSYNNRPQRAHRMAYIFTYGPIEGGLSVLHSCDNPPCCNPAHLFIGTQADNIADMVAKGRHGHG